jgi:hypothetical protein
MDKKTAVLTYLHTPFWGSDEFYRSTNRLGLHVHNAWKTEEYSGSVGCIVEMIYKGLLELKEQGYTHVIYSDAADTFFLKSFEVPEFLLISCEKACFPDSAVAEKYPNPASANPWKYVNAGNWCSPIDIAIKFYETYGLAGNRGKHINGQREWHTAFLQAWKDKFPIMLDWNCTDMQSIAFEDPGDYSIIIERKMDEWPIVLNDVPKIRNNKTGTFPAVFHGNGRTDMFWIYSLISK